MSARVRFASGLWLQYNGCTSVRRELDYTVLMDKRGGSMIAQVPTAACVVEFHMPCIIGWSNDFAHDKAVNEAADKRFADYRAVERRAKARAKKRVTKRRTVGR